MSKDQPRVPEMRDDPKPNREQRRHPERSQRAGGGVPDTGHDVPMENPTDEMLRPERTQDDFSVRAKNSGHGKKTADKWNQ